MLSQNYQGRIKLMRLENKWKEELGSYANVLKVFIRNGVRVRNESKDQHRHDPINNIRNTKKEVKDQQRSIFQNK